MGRGKDSKLRRRNRRKEEGGAAVTDMFGVQDDDDDDDATNQVVESVPLPPSLSGDAPVEEDTSDDEKVATTSLPKKKKKKKTDDVAALLKSKPKKEGIKTLPLIFLILMTGTTLLPVVLYAGDYVSAFLAKSNLMGSLGHRLNFGHVPRKRVLSFYEKHAPEKVPDVPKILAKHHGDYPLLIKKLERKYQDYGYFVGWEQDESPQRWLRENMSDAYAVWIKIWNRYAPQLLKTAARNARYNLTTVYKKGYKIWKRSVWPKLEPILGVPEGAEKQKRQDAAAAARKRRAANSGPTMTTRRKNRDYRDDVEDD